MTPDSHFAQFGTAGTLGVAEQKKFDHVTPVSTPKSPHLVIDGDIYIWRCSSAAERRVRWGNGVWSWYADEAQALAYLNISLHFLMGTLSPSKITVALSDNSLPYFRRALWPSYKCNRVDGYRPLCYQGVRDAVSEIHTSVSHPGLEADDCMGTMAAESNVILVSIDKDLRTVPGLHFNPDHPDLGVFKVSQQQADWHHMLQTLMGDATDGYPGCAGIGEKRARDLLEKGSSIDDWWPMVVEKFGDADMALRMARVARILRPGEFSKGQPQLWEPPIAASA